MTRLARWLDGLSTAMNIFTAGYLYATFGDLWSRSLYVATSATMIILLLVQVEFLLSGLKRNTDNVLRSGAKQISS